MPGQRLIESDLCDLFGVGRNTVREAFQRLASYGVIDTKRNRGATIRTLNIEEALDILEVNQALTALTARVAARAVRRGRDARRLRTALEAVAAVHPSADDAVILSAIKEFQLAELQLVDNLELRRYLTTMHLHAVRAQFLRHIYRWLYDDVCALGEAILAGKEPEAEACAFAFVQHEILILKKSARGMSGATALGDVERFIPLGGA